MIDNNIARTRNKEGREEQNKGSWNGLECQLEKSRADVTKRRAWQFWIAQHHSTTYYIIINI
jgi:hypothetical protein